jgi:hypothetical protein
MNPGVAIAGGLELKRENTKAQFSKSASERFIENPHPISLKNVPLSYRFRQFQKMGIDLPADMPHRQVSVNDRFDDHARSFVERDLSIPFLELNDRLHVPP